MANTYRGNPVIEGRACIIKADVSVDFRDEIDGIQPERDRADKIREALQHWVNRRRAKRAGKDGKG